MSEKNSPEVAIIGFGGCGNNIVQYLQGQNCSGFQFVQVDDDAESLAASPADIKMSCADCADEEKVRALFPGLRLFFMIGGLGGSSCAHMPEMARSLAKTGALSVGLLTTPFKFENRQEKAEKDLKAVAEELGRVCTFVNSIREGEAPDSQSLARRMRSQAENMWICIDVMTNKRTDPDKYDLKDLDRLVSGMGGMGNG